MKIWVSSLAKVYDTAARAQPSRAVSLLSPGDIFPQIDGVDDHHKIHMHDIRAPQEGHVTPGETHVAELIEFLKSWSPDNPLLIHCWAGISRSTATAFIAACLHNPDADEMAIATSLKAASPTAFPNTLIAAHADKILKRDGRMTAAVEEICADKERAERVSREMEGMPFHIPAHF